MLVKLLLSALLLLSVTVRGCGDDPPPPSPKHSVSILEAEIYHRAVIVRANFTGPANSTASAGLYSDRTGVHDRQTIEFDAKGHAYASFYYEQLGTIKIGAEFTVGVTADDGKTSVSILQLLPTMIEL